MSGFGVLEIQKAVYSKLKNDSTLSAMIMGVYDRVPDGSSFPYVTIGEADCRDWSSVTANGIESELTLFVYSRGGGRKQALEIMERIYALLHEGSFSMTGHSLIQSRFERSDVRLLNDGHTYRGSMGLRLFSMEVI
jgi:hypothetical protein